MRTLYWTVLDCSVASSRIARAENEGGGQEWQLIRLDVVYDPPVVVDDASTVQMWSVTLCSPAHDILRRHSTVQCIT
ncbi:hypothetical protein BDW22DRAFT_1356730 [Trametopsis cervina]|nr:hypothetical protein BDW22DRAFT_1356730 [Trametopsis cervina]